MSRDPTTEAPAAGPPAAEVVGQAPAAQAKESQTGEIVEAGDPAAAPPAPAERPEFNPAAWMHERLVKQIVDFEKGLDPDHEVGGRFVSGPNAEALHIENVASWGPDMIIFVGKFSDGRRFEIIQHYSQVNLFLVAMRTTAEEPRRIGFELLRTMKEDGPSWGDPVS